MDDLFINYIKKYQELFGLENWEIIIKTDNTLPANAKTIADPRYYRATIDINPVNVDVNNIDKVIIHEFIHIVMALYDFYADNLGKEGSDELFFVARENSVSQLTHIILRLLKVGDKNE